MMCSSNRYCIAAMSRPKHGGLGQYRRHAVAPFDPSRVAQSLQGMQGGVGPTVGPFGGNFGPYPSRLKTIGVAITAAGCRTWRHVLGPKWHKSPFLGQKFKFILGPKWHKYLWPAKDPCIGFCMAGAAQWAAVAPSLVTCVATAMSTSARSVGFD
jgi:hypothetical protein